MSHWVTGRFAAAIVGVFPCVAHAKGETGEDLFLSLILAAIFGVSVGILVTKGKSTIIYFWMMWTVIGHSIVSFMLYLALSDAWTARGAFVSNLIGGLIVIPLSMWLTRVVMSELANPGSE